MHIYKYKHNYCIFICINISSLYSNNCQIAILWFKCVQYYSHLMNPKVGIISCANMTCKITFKGHTKKGISWFSMSCWFFPTIMNRTESQYKIYQTLLLHQSKISMKKSKWWIQFICLTVCSPSLRFLPPVPLSISISSS